MAFGNTILDIIIPNREPLFEWTANKIRRIFYKKSKLSGAIYPDMHVLGFNLKSLRKLTERFGFTSLSAYTVSMGNQIFYPWGYDGLINVDSKWYLTNNWKYWIPKVIAPIGNYCGMGDWIVGYFRKNQLIPAKNSES